MQIGDELLTRLGQLADGRLHSMGLALDDIAAMCSMRAPIQKDYAWDELAGLVRLVGETWDSSQLPHAIEALSDALVRGLPNFLVALDSEARYVAVENLRSLVHAALKRTGEPG